MNELMKVDNIKIENMIYEVRGKQIMLDSDLAKLYGVETKRINEAVYRNKEKFPERFSFKLTDEEVKKLEVANCDLKFEESYNLKSELLATNKKEYGGRRYNPRVFT